VLHPPVPAAELPELPGAKVPFWKKEIGRKPKAPKAAKAEKEPKAASTPFWKKELSFARKQEAPVADLPEPVEIADPAEPKVPFWKKQIGGKPKAAKEYKKPRAKRSFSLPELSLPSLSRGGGHQVKRLVGLKVGGSQLAAARVANNGAAELLQVARVDLPPGVVVSGELRDPDSLANALREFFAKNKLPKKNVRLGIASNRIGVRTFEITGIDDPKQLENAIHFRAQEALPIPLDEAVLDYHVLEERADEEGTKTKRVLLVVAYRELIDRYVDACKKAGIVLSGIDLEAFALLRALSAPRPETEAGDSALVAVAIGHDRSTFAVSDGRVCDFTRVLEWGGSALNVAIARALDLAPSEAEVIKRAVSLSSSEVPDGIAYEQYSLAVDAVRKQVHTFARELVSSLQFYQNQPGSLGIGEIVITGGTANLVGIADELQRLIGVQVRVGDPLARLKVTKKLALDEPMGSLAVAIGLGIED
jgi:type IV pilus assembly protein PilM